MAYNIHATIPWDYTVDSINTTGIKLTSFERPEFRSSPKDIVVYVKSVGDFFKLDFDSTLTADGITIVTYSGGAGRWIRLNVENEQFLKATFWSVSPATGSDENIGWGLDAITADSHPLATMAELNRRLIGYKHDNLCSGSTILGIDIHIMDDINEASFCILTNLKQINDAKYLRIRGNIKQVEPASMNLTITGYTAAVPSTNTIRKVAFAGLGLKPSYIGKMIQTVDGSKTAFIVKQDTPDIFYISEVRDGGSTIDGETGSNVTNFTIGDHVNITDLVRIPLWPIPDSGVAFPLFAQFRLSSNGETVGYGFSSLGKMQGIIAEVIFGDGIVGHVNDFVLDGGDGYLVQSCLMMANHGNRFQNGSMQALSCAALINGDGPFFDNFSIAIGNELLFTPLITDTITGAGHGFRTNGFAPCTISIDDIGVICSIAMTGATFTLGSTHNGEPGNFNGCDSFLTHSLWYGINNAWCMLVLPRGTRSKFPVIGYTAITSFASQISMAGKGIGDTGNFFNFSDIPIIDLSTMSIMQDSTPARF